MNKEYIISHTDDGYIVTQTIGGLKLINIFNEFQEFQEFISNKFVLGGRFRYLG